MSVNKVLYNIDQRSDTSDAEKATARANIGAVGSSDIPEITRVDTSAREYDVDSLKFQSQSVSTAIIKGDSTELGSTVPAPALASDEGKVPVAYYRDGRKYFLLEQYKDPRIPDSASADYHKVLTVDSHGNAIWQLPASGGAVSPYFLKTTVNLAGGTMQYPTLIDIPNAVIPAGKTLVGTLTLSNYGANGVVRVGAFAGELGGSLGSDVYEFFTGAELGGTRRNTFTLPVKQSNTTAADILLKMGLNGSVTAQTLGVIIQGILY